MSQNHLFWLVYEHRLDSCRCLAVIGTKHSWGNRTWNLVSFRIFGWPTDLWRMNKWRDNGGALTGADVSKMLPVAMQSSVTSVLPTSTADLASQLWQRKRLKQLRSVYPETQRNAKADFTMKPCWLFYETVYFSSVLETKNIHSRWLCRCEHWIWKIAVLWFNMRLNIYRHVNQERDLVLIWKWCRLFRLRVCGLTIVHQITSFSSTCVNPCLLHHLHLLHEG